MHNRTIRRRTIVAALVLVITLSVAAPASAGTKPPARIRVTAPVHSVYCWLGCCCGTVEASYAGHYYDTGAQLYCRWFRPLTDGQLVTATLTLSW